MIHSDAATPSPTFLYELITQPFTKEHVCTRSRFFSTVLRAPTYPTDLLFTHSTRQAKTRPITLNSKSLIYMIQCKRRHKQYAGETKRRLKDRFNEHRRRVDKPTNRSKPTSISENFLTNHRTANDIPPIP